MSAVAGQLKLEQDWSPLCEACLSKLKSAKFRDAVLERTKPLKYDIRIDEFVNGCVLCSLITRQLNYREPGSASRITIARVSISRWEEPSELYLSVNSSPSLSLNLFTRPNDPAAKEIATTHEDVNSHWAWDQAHRWISECIGTHVSCPDTGNFFPRRVIDLGVDPPRLLAEHHKIEPYVTLSYCWGGPQLMCLKKERLTDYMVRVPVRKLPQTILDAFHTTKRLGFRYIWVDSMCIIQDDENDKIGEIAQMITIYRQSALTIVAANAQSVEHGFLGPREDFVASRERIPFLCKDGALGTVTLSTSRPILSYYPCDNPIETRAWTYQERLMSSRVLIYSYNGLRFACRNTVQSSVKGTPWIESHRQPSYVEISRNDVWMWRDLVQEYSSRLMSDPGDKPLAMSGLARVHAEGRGPADDYLAGLWRKSIAMDLLWQSSNEKRAKDATSYFAPSWSWLSTDSTIKWPSVLRGLGPLAISRGFELLGTKVVPKAGHDLYGQIYCGYLEVRSHVLCLSQNRVKELGWGSSPAEESAKISTWRPTPLLPNPRTLDGSQTRLDGETWLFDPVDSSSFRMSFDSDDAGRTDISLLLILMGSSDLDPAEPRLRVYCGLILENSSETVETLFRRAGVFEFKIDQGPHPYVSDLLAGKKPSVAQSRDFSCLRGLESAPIEDLTII